MRSCGPYRPKSESPPPNPTIVGTYGTISTLNPLAEKCFSIYQRAVLLPAQGPPVNATRYMGYFLCQSNYSQINCSLSQSGILRQFEDTGGTYGSRACASNRSYRFCKLWQRRVAAKVAAMAVRASSQRYSEMRSGILPITIERYNQLHMSVQQLQGRTQQKLKGLTADNSVSAMAQFLKNRDIIRRDLEMFQNIVGHLQDKDYDTLMQTLKEDDCQILLDYLHRFMQYVGESENQAISSGLMLKLYERIIKEYGPSLIIGACLRTDTLVSKISNY